MASEGKCCSCHLVIVPPPLSQRDKGCNTETLESLTHKPHRRESSFVHTGIMQGFTCVSATSLTINKLPVIHLSLGEAQHPSKHRQGGSEPFLVCANEFQHPYGHTQRHWEDQNPFSRVLMSSSTFLSTHRGSGKIRTLTRVFS